MKKSISVKFKRFVVSIFIIISIISIFILVLFTTIMYKNIKRYPDFAKEYYYKNINESYNAYINEKIHDNFINKDNLLKLVKGYGFTPVEYGKYYYLSVNDSERITVRDKFFKNISMYIPRTKEINFWSVKIKEGLIIVEASTGRGYYYKNNNGKYKDFITYYDKIKIDKLVY